jgi:hypothetical protein
VHLTVGDAAFGRALTPVHRLVTIRASQLASKLSHNARVAPR